MQPISSQQRLKAYYKTTLGVFLLSGGILGLGFGLWKAAAGADGLSVLTVGGVGLFLFGCYCLNRPYFLLEPRQLTVYNLLGLVTKRYTFDSWDVVKADNRRIYIDDGGITKKVPVAPWLVKTDDWATMRKLL
ncbi:MAG: hypothetical protein WA885_20520 [Phormidesmis sp.]